MGGEELLRHSVVNAACGGVSDIYHQRRQPERLRCHKPKCIVILSEVAASLREASTQSKDLYSSRTRLRPPLSEQPSMRPHLPSPEGSFDSVGRFANRIGQLRSG